MCPPKSDRDREVLFGTLKTSGKLCVCHFIGMFTTRKILTDHVLTLGVMHAACIAVVAYNVKVPGLVHFVVCAIPLGFVYILDLSSSSYLR